MRYAATPGEVAGWLAEFEHLGESKRKAIVAFISEVVSDCTGCGEPVRRCDPRILRNGDLTHLRCAGTAAASTPPPPSPRHGAPPRHGAQAHG